MRRRGNVFASIGSEASSKRLQSMRRKSIEAAKRFTPCCARSSLAREEACQRASLRAIILSGRRREDSSRPCAARQH